jgi:endonuclease G, mitochondrial
MTGYDPTFLGAEVAAPGGAPGLVRLDYVHFSVWLDPSRRLAALTGVNLDGGTLLDLPRGENWRIDSRVPESQQAGEALYAHNDLDRGHLVRRRDPVWGQPDVAATANSDTFHYTNAAPQVSDFNQSKILWGGLEDYLLDHAATYDSRLTVFTGPVLAPDDPVYRSVAIPRRFSKVAVWADAGTLAATGYVLDQSDLLAQVLEAEPVGVLPTPPLGAYRTYQVPIRDIAQLTGLAMSQLEHADRFPPSATPTAQRPAWVELRDHRDITFRPRQR